MRDVRAGASRGAMDESVGAAKIKGRAMDQKENVIHGPNREFLMGKEKVPLFF
jgi:hypothetical protein